MIRLFHRWMKANSVMLVNAGSLVGTTAVTSVLGFVYWWLAARRFPPEVIGIASASISAMMLLGGFCVLGLGTLLITELPRQPGKEPSLISTALLVVGGVGGCTGAIFAIVAPYLSANFQVLAFSATNITIFATGVSLTAITLVLDQALIGILRGGLQLGRNTLFALSKLFALFAAATWLLHTTGITIYTTWATGSAFSLLGLAAFVVFKKGSVRRGYLPEWALLRKLGPAALQHHLLNLTLQAPTLILPVLVTALLSARMNAWFYVSWMIANFVFVAPIALTTVLHAMNSAQRTTMAHKVRMTIGLALATSLLVNCLLQFGTEQILNLFGNSYTEQATWSLRILGLAAFPLTIKNHYISICRIQDRITRAMFAMAPGGLLELITAALGARLGGLSGLSLGWVLAICIESIFMLRTLYNAVRSSEIPPQRATEEALAKEAVRLIEIAITPVIGQNYAGAEAIWYTDTVSLPMVGQQSKGAKTLIPKKPAPCIEGNVHHSGRRLRLKPPRLEHYH